MTNRKERIKIQKVTKNYRRIEEKYYDEQKVDIGFAAKAQLQNHAEHTILSVNPLDYLTMSFGNSWASCHTIDKQNKREMPNSYQGMYSSGTISYMLDSPSMVFYTVDASYDGNDFWHEPKINRQMYHWGEDKLIQGRLYPQDNDGCSTGYTAFRAIVQKIMSEIFDFPNFWTVSKGTSEAGRYIDSEGTHYRDYNNFSNCTSS